MDRLLRDTFVFLKNSKRCGQKSFRVFSRNRATFLKHPHKVDNDGESGKGNTLDFRKFDGFVSHVGNLLKPIYESAVAFSSI